MKKLILQSVAAFLLLFCAYILGTKHIQKVTTYVNVYGDVECYVAVGWYSKAISCLPITR